MNFKDFFDENKVEHVNAYIHLTKKGSWPEGFIPEDIVYDVAWQLDLVGRFANLYIKEFKNKRGEK